jgi:putative endopeptidase
VTALADCQLGTNNNATNTNSTVTGAPTPGPTPGATYPSEWTPVLQGVIASMNLSADPCEDFYEFACGGWLNSTELPASRHRWARSFDTLQNDTEAIELRINEAGWPLIGDFYAACMNVTALDAAGAAPIQPALQQLLAVQTTSQLVDALAALHLDGVDPLFAFSSGVDDRNPNRTIALFDQGGLDLPRATYLANDSDALALRGALQTFAATLFDLLGAPFNASSNASAAWVVQFETQLANISFSNEERRSPEATYNKIGLAGLANWTTSLNWTQYTDAVGLRAGWNASEVNVQSPPFFKGLDALLAPLLGGNATSRDLVNFVAFKYVSSVAGLLSQPFRDALFQFGVAQSGTDVPPPRYRQCIGAADSSALGELVGHYFVNKHFEESTKQAVQLLVNEAEEAFGARMRDVDWLANSTATLALAEEKLAAIRNKIGYPDTWQKYTSLRIGDSHFDNVRTLTRIAEKDDAALVDTATNKNRFDMVPQEINAYYQPVFNEIVFPAGILRGSFFNPQQPGALNYGGIGGVISHEISHGFDDQGRQYDKDGVLRNWWPQSVVDAFKERVACVVDVYSNFTVMAGNETVHCNGNQTLGENLADMGGIANAFRAYVARLANDSAFAAAEEQIPNAFQQLAGKPITKEQLYFVGWGLNWCTLQTPAALKRQIATDPHSPAEIRVLGPISQTPAFQDAFKCASGSKYAPAQRCSVW